MWIAGIVVLGMVAVAGFSQGVFFQGNFSLTQKELTQRDLTTRDLTQRDLTTKDLTTKELTTRDLTTKDLTTKELTQRDLTTRDLTQLTTLQLVPTSNQLRAGSNSLFKAALTASKESVLKRMKLSLALSNLAINNVTLVMNGTQDVTDQLTAETRSTFNTALRAEKRNLTTTVALVFKENFKIPAGLTTFELVFNVNAVSKESTMVGGLLDAVLSTDGIESVVEGPADRVKLENTYSQMK